jgi:hypothetical protein
MYKFDATMYWHTYKLQATIGLLPAMLDQNSTTPLTDGTRKHTQLRSVETQERRAAPVDFTSACITWLTLVHTCLTTGACSQNMHPLSLVLFHREDG